MHEENKKKTSREGTKTEMVKKKNMDNTILLMAGGRYGLKFMPDGQI
jgi:hypothetical protein